jgi:hypothetical protein
VSDSLAQDGSTALVQRKQLSLQEVNTAASVVMAASAAVQMLGALRPHRRIEMGHSIVRAREAHKAMRRRIAMEVQQREHTAAACIVAGLVGVYEARNHASLPGVFGIDGAVVFGAASLLAGEYIGGRGGRIAQSVADGLLSVGSYKYAKAFSKSGLPKTSSEGVGDINADARAMDALLAAG